MTEKNTSTSSSALSLKSPASPVEALPPGFGKEGWAEAMEAFQSMGFFIEITQDGSPSLRLKDSSLKDSEGEVIPGESMHHSGGAYSETDLIYGQPIRQILDRFQGGAFLIVGLGLGYIEIMVAKEALVRGIPSSQIKLLSFESVPELRGAFLRWVTPDSQSSREPNSQTNIIYEEIARRSIEGTSLSISHVSAYLRELYEADSRIEGALTTEVNWDHRFEGILYDAFSAKTTPLLWEEEFLVDFLGRAASREYALLSTYACRGSLKRALQKSGFEVYVREGFKGKRNSTWGLRKNLDYRAK